MFACLSQRFRNKVMQVKPSYRVVPLAAADLIVALKAAAEQAEKIKQAFSFPEMGGGEGGGGGGVGVYSRSSSGWC